jgi:hypothetical protein
VKRALIGLAALLIASGCASPRAVEDCTITAETCRESGCRGWVDVKFRASDTGEVLDPEVIRSCPAGYADDLALQNASGRSLPSSSWGREGVLRLQFSTELLPSSDIFELVEGTWGWASPFDRRYQDMVEEGCVKNPFTLRFSGDRSILSLAQTHPSSVAHVELPTKGVTSRELRYRVVGHTETSIQIEPDDGNRDTASNPSIQRWELRMAPKSPTQYLYWYRGERSSGEYDWAERCRRTPRFADRPAS